MYVACSSRSLDVASHAASLCQVRCQACCTGLQQGHGGRIRYQGMQDQRRGTRWVVPIPSTFPLPSRYHCITGHRSFRTSTTDQKTDKIAGPFDTPGLRHMMAKTGDTEEDWYAPLPMQRLGDAQEAAPVVAFLLGSHSSFITVSTQHSHFFLCSKNVGEERKRLTWFASQGACIPLDGGWTAV